MKKAKENKKLNMDEKPVKKTSKKKSVILYSCIGVPIIALGIVGGVLLGQNVFKVDAYAGLDAEKINEDFSAVYTKYQRTSSDKYFKAFSDVEIANISLMNLNSEESFYTLSTGNVIAAGVKQNINSTYIKYKGDYFEESITESSFVKAANRFYEDEEGVSWHKGKYAGATNGDYSKATLTEYTIDDFEEIWGRPISRACVYIVTNQTRLEGSITDNNDGTHTISLDLDPTLSVLRYIKQMTMTGGLSQKPVFHTVNLKFTVDDNLKLLKFETDECYDVHMVIDAKNSKGKLTQEFFYEERSIPKINEPSNYEK